MTHACICLPAFSSKTNQKLHDIHETPKFVKEAITRLDFSGMSRPDYISVVVLTKWKPKFILAELFNQCV